MDAGCRRTPKVVGLLVSSAGDGLDYVPEGLPLVHPAPPDLHFGLWHMERDPTDVDERDPSTTSVAQHMIAGSFAGVAEHGIMFPIDTIKTMVQAGGGRAAGGEAAVQGGTSARLALVRQLVANDGLGVLWRGVSVVPVGCIPAHAMMFSAYETIVEIGGSRQEDAPARSVAMVGALAGGISTLFHDAVMVPTETVKQLGYYRDARHCLERIIANGGGSLYRSMPTTLAMNVPYSSVMMMSNETLRKWLNPTGEFNFWVYLLSGCLSGAFAAGLTTPLDVVKTALQTQGLRPPTETLSREAPKHFQVRYNTAADAAKAIWRANGVLGFLWGLKPRMLQMGPSCAISWCAYESAKHLIDRFQFGVARIGYS